jgi:transformation/transcription domain-associated protein
LDLGNVHPIQTGIKLLDSTGDLLKGFVFIMFLDLRVQFRTILLGIKTTLFTLNKANLSDYIYTPQTSSTSFRDEVDILASIFKNGLLCFEYFLTETETSKGSQPNANILLQSGKEDKETMETFSSIFTFVERCISFNASVHVPRNYVAKH